MCMSGIAEPLADFWYTLIHGLIIRELYWRLKPSLSRKESRGKYNWSVCFFTGFWVTVLGENEILTEVRILTDSANANSCFLKSPQPTSRYPYVGCAVTMSTSGWSWAEIRIGFSGIIPWLRSRWIYIPWLWSRRLNQRTSFERILDWCGISKSCFRPRPSQRCFFQIVPFQILPCIELTTILVPLLSGWLSSFSLIFDMKRPHFSLTLKDFGSGDWEFETSHPRQKYQWLTVFFTF